MSKTPANLYPEYHAHVYFEESTLDQAKELCIRAANELKVPVGHVHTRPVGPHPKWSCQFKFNNNNFDEVINWLENNRKGLTILIHGVTNDDLIDHTDHTSWLGKPEQLKLDAFKKQDL
jgi:DOPA 4,5-dioxygenase